MPNKAGDRGTTDRQAAGHVARLARAGDLPRVSVPKVEDEALRALTRVRAEAWGDRKAATLRLHAFVRRHAIPRDTGGAHWGPAPLRGRSEVVCPTPAQPMGLQAEVRAVTAPTNRLARLAHERHAPGNAWRVSPGVEALPALQDVPCTWAGSTVAARGALPRWDTPRALMQCVGLLPATDASGKRRRQGAMPQAGQTHARRALVAGA